MTSQTVQRDFPFPCTSCSVDSVSLQRISRICCAILLADVGIGEPNEFSLPGWFLISA